jgi:hypothetical protein
MGATPLAANAFSILANVQYDDSMATARITQKLQEWIDARQRHRLSHAHVQMARELGMNPRKLGKIDNHRQEPWKMPLPIFIEHLYEKRFGRARPEVEMSIEQIAAKKENAKKERRARKAQRKAAASPMRDSSVTDHADVLASTP